MADRNMRPIVMSELDTAFISGTFTAFDAAGLPESCSIIRIINASDTPISIGYGGGDDHDRLRAGDTLQLDFQANSKQSLVANLKKGTVVSIRGDAGTGLVYLVGYYQPVN